MKQFIWIVILLFSFIYQSVNAMTFQEAFADIDSKPAVVLIYAQWADGYQNYLTQFRKLQAKFKNQFNFVELDIASKDTKVYNSKYNIYQNLPYIMLYRNNGKITRYIRRECASSYSCSESKLKSFIQ